MDQNLAEGLGAASAILAYSAVTMCAALTDENK
jgi:hypothetical protein